MTIKDLLQQGANFLGESDTSFTGRQIAVLNTELILCHVLGVQKEFLLAHDEEEVDAPLVDLFQKYLQKVSDGFPLAYILKEKEFFGYNFYVDERVLIPRPETEHVVEKVLEFIEGIDGDNLKMLDVGTGSGNIAVSVAKKLEENESTVLSHVLAVDVDDGALEVAKMNVSQYSLSNLVQVAKSDLADVVGEGEHFDIITANLPYIGMEKNKFISASAEKYEPSVALFGGSDGFALYEKLFQQIKDKEISFRILIGEFGFAQSEGMTDLLNRYFKNWTFEKDLAGIDRLFIVKS